MAYKLKPNYHFADTSQLGINKVPVGRLIIVEDYGANHEIKWLRKTSQSLKDEYGNIIGVLDANHTINDALTYRCIEAPFDKKADISQVYTITEIDSMLTTKAEVNDVYDKITSDSIFRRNDDSYSAANIDSMLDNLSVNPKGIVQHANKITADVEIEYGNNAVSITPLTINDNVTVTINNGSVWKLI